MKDRPVNAPEPAEWESIYDPYSLTAQALEVLMWAARNHDGPVLHGLHAMVERVHQVVEEATGGDGSFSDEDKVRDASCKLNSAISLIHEFTRDGDHSLELEAVESLLHVAEMECDRMIAMHERKSQGGGV